MTPKIISNILIANSSKECFYAIKELSIFYEPYLQTISSNKKSQVNGGNAVSPVIAAACLNDYIRTTRFLQGIHKAIQDLLQRSPNQPVEVLYAGCGPLGTLILPLFSVFSPKQLQVTFLDIHESSIFCLKQIIQDNEWQEFVKEMHVVDATIYAATQPYDLIISETMLNALIDEPQVTISAHLQPYLKEGGIFIPENILIDLAFTDYASLYRFNQPISFTDSQPVDIPSEETEAAIPITTLSKLMACITKKQDSFITSPIQVPKNRKPDIVLITTIQVYQDIMIVSSTSHITNPHCIGTCNQLTTERFKLVYEITPNPHWQIVEA
jgi:hypothetical protein